LLAARLEVLLARLCRLQPLLERHDEGRLSRALRSQRFALVLLDTQRALRLGEVVHETVALVGESCQLAAERRDEVDGVRQVIAREVVDVARRFNLRGGNEEKFFSLALALFYVCYRWMGWDKQNR
jgi:hypothetical protein